MTSFGPCESWPVAWPACKELETASPTVTGRAVAAATQILWGLSGRRFGECQMTLRPCRRDCSTAPWPGGYSPWSGGMSWPQPLLHGGVWFNVICGSCPGECSCTSLSEVVLPSPVSSIIAVKVNGISLAVTGAYRLDDNRLLVRLGGFTWPSCQELNKDDTQVGTWSVTAKFGEPVPELGQMAMGELACELLKAMRGVDCRLPQQVTSLARQGVNISFPDPTSLLAQGRLGLYMADLFIETVNPGGLKAPSQAYRVDGREPRRVST